MNKWNEFEVRVFNFVAAETYRMLKMGVKLSNEELNQIEEEFRKSWVEEMDFREMTPKEKSLFKGE